MRILIIRLSSIGDIVLTQPVVKVLRGHFPQAKIEYITKKGYNDIVESFGDVDQIHHWEKKSALLKILRKYKYDLIIDLHRKINSFIIKTLLRSKKTITYNKQHCRRWLITKKIIKTANDYTSNLYLNTLKKIGISYGKIEPQLRVSSNIDKEISKLFARYKIDGGSKLIGIFPGTLHQTKQYPTAYYSKFINSVPDDWNCLFLILGSEEDLMMGLELVEKTDHKIINLCGKLGLRLLIGLMSHLEVVISGDTGPMHIAAGLNLNQIAIFGATHPLLGFSPRNNKAVILTRGIDCQPCSLHGDSKCPRRHFRCMLEIEPEQIKQSLQSFLQTC